MLSNYTLIGYMGCGKTTIGRYLSKYLKYNFYDLDQLIIENKKKNINNIFKELGEKKFRNIESFFLKKILKKKICFISRWGNSLL